tara:strand:+ start:256 stop:645 length:390 start_codon:yes stop_codon:yes gene_type:complete
MATRREYAYYVRGRQLAIIEFDVDTTTDTITYRWQSPTTTVNDGILLDYAVKPKAKDGGEITDESDEIDINDTYARALVYYLKARFAEDAKEIKEKEYYMREFWKIIERQEDTKLAGPRIISSGYNAIR